MSRLTCHKLGGDQPTCMQGRVRSQDYFSQLWSRGCHRLHFVDWSVENISSRVAVDGHEVIELMPYSLYGSESRNKLGL
jgi:hypothetical protein